MADWSLPTLTKFYDEVISLLKGRDEDAMTMTAGTNVPVGTVRLNRTTGQFEEWDGANWNILPNIAWAGQRTNNYIWARKDGSTPLLATIGNNVSGNISQFNWSENSGDDGVIRAAIFARQGATALRIYNASDSAKVFYLSVDGNINILNAYDYSTSTPLDFQIGYNSSQNINIPAMVEFTARYISLTEGQATLAFDDQTAPDGYGIKRLTCNDGSGNFNLRCLSYNDGTIDKYTTGGSGATAITQHAENTDGYIRLLAAPVGVSANDAITWSTEVRVDKNGVFINGNKIWHEGNDGAGSGLDADLLDGKHANEIGQLAGGSTAIGYQALFNDDSTDNYNTAFGYYAGNSISSGYNNVIIGSFAAKDATTGYNSVIIGNNAAAGGGSVGGNNVAIGRYSGYSLNNYSGTNTLIGASSGRSITSSDFNTCVGASAGFYITTGQNNICLGSGAGADASPFYITTESNIVVIGDNDITNAYIKVAWSVTSDKRDKTDIADIPYGLEFVSKLKPRRFRFDDRSRYWKPIEDKNGNIVDYDKSKQPDGSKKDNDYLWGFISQEVLEAQEELGIEESPVVDTSNPERLSLKETALIPILVNAVKELSNEIDSLKNEIKTIKEKCCEGKA